MAAINEAATKWHDSVNRPKIAEEVLHTWDALLIDWIQDDTMPLFVRSSKDIRGTEVTHKSGNRVLIPSDNSPAHWSFALAESGKTPTLAGVREALCSDAIPFAMAIKADHKHSVKYSCTLGKLRDNPNKLGWKIAHIIPVGMNNRVHFCELPIREIKSHFLYFMSPRNMYVVPKNWSGLSEIEPINQFFLDALGNSLANLHERALAGLSL